MKKIVYALFLFLIAFNIYLSIFSALHGEVNFFNDVGRDFLLLQELDQKKIVFIGPRSNTSGVFHGPLWTYINYPAYIVGGGNPLFQEWFWILVGGVFLITGFFIAKKLFGSLPALAYVLLLSVKLVPHINGVFHSEATFFIIPIFFFSMGKYITTKKVRWLSFHLITAAALIQLNIGDGIPFFILSALVAVWVIVKKKLWVHLVSFLLVPLCLVNFIAFDSKHNFQIARALFTSGTGSKFFINISYWIQNRIENTVSLQLFEGSNGYWLLVGVIFIAVLTATWFEFKRKSKLRPIYALFAYYYFGYMVLTYFNKGVLLFHYVYLLIPLTLLWLVSFLRGKYIAFFAVLVGLVYVINLNYATSYVQALQNSFMGKNPNSWKALSAAAQVVIKNGQDREFGYFVFAPDSFAYQPRYAMSYNFKALGAKASEYVKKKTTYIIAQPPPANDPYMDYKWWVKVPVGITAKPFMIRKLPSGYTVLGYHLTDVEQKILHDPAIEIGIHFR